MYNVTIGLEIHCELKTNSKVFSTGKNEYNDEANVNLSPVDLGFPGVLPVLNKEAVRKAILVSSALNSKISNKTKFDRKNYFYPDLPKGYQITQSREPFGTNGYLMIHVGEKEKKVLIHDLHLEEDTASLDHFNDYSLLNFNRAGVPLIEIVTEPCLNSSEEAISFLEELRNVIRYTGASDARSDRGEMRCDVNISLSKDETLGTKVEMKNINSFYNVKEAIDYEIKRQSELLDKGEKILQETRRFDSTDKKTYSMRSKVDSIDYKYFPEPNIPVLEIEEEFINEIKNSLPKLPFERVKEYIEKYNLSRKDANTLVKEKEISDYFEKTISLGCSPKLVSNWITTKILGYLNKENIKINEFYLKEEYLHELISLIENEEITSQQAKEVFDYCFLEKKTPKEITKEKNIKASSNNEELQNIVKKVIEENPEVINDYKNGKERMLDYLVGQVMKYSKGTANPIKAKEIMLKDLNG